MRDVYIVIAHDFQISPRGESSVKTVFFKWFPINKIFLCVFCQARISKTDNLEKKSIGGNVCFCCKESTWMKVLILILCWFWKPGICNLKGKVKTWRNSLSSVEREVSNGFIVGPDIELI